MDEQNGQVTESFEQAEQDIGAETVKPNFLHNKKIIAAIIASVAVIAAIIVGISISGNTYKTPLKGYEDVYNVKGTDLERVCDGLNGFAESEIRRAFEIRKESESFSNLIELVDESKKADFHKKQDRYGKNYKVRLEIADKAELSETELKNYQAKMLLSAKVFSAYVNNSDSESGIKRIMYDYDLSHRDAEKLLEVFRKLAKVLESAEVTEGYGAVYKITETGSELEDAKTSAGMIDLIKVNGRWIAGDAVGAALQILTT